MSARALKEFLPAESPQMNGADHGLFSDFSEMAKAGTAQEFQAALREHLMVRVYDEDRDPAGSPAPKSKSRRS